MDNRERITSNKGFGSVSLEYRDGYDLPWRLYYHNYDPTTGNYTQSGLIKEISYNQYMDKPNTLVMKQGDNEIEKHIFTHEQQERSFSDQGVTYRIRKERLGNLIKVYAGEDLLMEKTSEDLQEEIVLHSEEPYTSTTTYDIYGRKITSGPLSYHYISNSGSPIAQDLDYIEDSSTGNIVQLSYADGEKVGFTVSDTNNNPLFGVHKSGNKADYSFSGVQSETREERDDSVINIRENTILNRQSYIYQKDSFNRISSKTSVDGTYIYTYLTQGNRTFIQVNTLSYQSGGGAQILFMQCQFSYDGRGNISREDVTCSLQGQSTHTVIEYVYDSLSRLTEVKKDNVSLYSYTFNSTGRLSSVLHNGTQRVFTYDSKERISSSVVDGSDAFSDSFDYTYDNLGNRKRKALHYSGQTKEIYFYERGNLLSEIKDAYGNVIVSYSYDGWGRRWTKTSAGITHTYYYDDDNKLIGEDLSDNRKLRFFYDKEGICGFSLYRNSTWESFSYVRNLHGDILFIRDSQGKTIVKYEYSPYGEVSSTLLDSTKEYIRQINPFLYRGYYYDKESSLYYLLSRYYDPSEGVFLTMDDINMIDPGIVSGLDLYCYCRHNPVNYSDRSGHFPVLTAILIGLGATLLVGGGLIAGGRLSGNEALTNIGDTIISVGETVAGIAMIATGVGGPFGMALLGTGIGSFTNGLITMSNGGSYHAGWAGGQLSGALSLIPYFGGAIGAFAGSALTDLIDSDYDFNQIDWAKAGASAGIAFGLSWFGNAVPWGDIQFNKAAQFALSYDYALLGISNSIINVYWRGRQK